MDSSPFSISTTQFQLNPIESNYVCKLLGRLAKLVIAPAWAAGVPELPCRLELKKTEPMRHRVFELQRMRVEFRAQGWSAK